MTDLNPKEIDLLDRMALKPELEPYFFRKAKGIKWFDELVNRGYYDVIKNPEPVPADQEGHFRIPTWYAVDYLVTISPDLKIPENIVYAQKTLDILWSVTKSSSDRGVSNYRTWWKFSLVLCELPLELIDPTEIRKHLPYWLSDQFGRELAAEELGQKWLPFLLDANTSHSCELALELIQTLYKVSFVEKSFMGRSRLDIKLPVDKYHLGNITCHIYRVGEIIGHSSVNFFLQNMRIAIEKLDNDSYSSTWRPAIEEHKQNEPKDDELGTLVVCIRDSISGLLVSDVNAAKTIVSDLLNADYQTLRRIGIYLVNEHYQTLSHFSEKVIVKDHFCSNMLHEVWKFLEDRYGCLSPAQQDRVLKIIDSLERKDDDGNPHPGFTAYAQAVWLAAVRGYDPTLEALYKEKTTIANAEPDHPDFSSYMWSGFKGNSSPLTQEEILTLPTSDLINYLNEYQPAYSFDGPSIEGLASTLRSVVRDNPLRYFQELESFTTTNTYYLHALIEGYSEAWKAKQQLPWKDIWDQLLFFFLNLISKDSFWDQKGYSSGGPNNDWIVNSIGRLLEQGMKDDEHAFDASLLPKAETLILKLLDKQKGSDSFADDRDAVSIAINSPRGNCLEALINYGLRRCRLEDKDFKNHDQVWKEVLEPIFDRELNKETAVGYEFATLIANYLRNFMYMSFSWTKSKLPEIFDQSDNLRWSCAMEGLAYVGTLHDDIYLYLREHGDFILALDNDKLRDYVHENVVQNIGIGYLRKLECLNDPNSLIVQLLNRNKSEELGTLISFFSPFKDDFDEVVRKKSLQLWPEILRVLDKETIEGRKLASRLCRWLGYVEEINDENRTLIYQTVEFAGADYNAYDTLQHIARLSRTQPMEAGRLWMTMLKGTSEDYPKEAVQEALRNLINHSRDGKRLADEICSKYIEHGTDRPNEWRNEILNQISQ